MNQIEFLTTQIVTLKTTGRGMKKNYKTNPQELGDTIFCVTVSSDYNLVIKMIREMPLTE